MVKKISGTTPTNRSEATTGIRSGGVTGGAKIDSVKEVGALSGGGRAEKIRRPTRPITAEERQHLLSLIDEEADKLFGATGLPESKRAMVTNSVKMTINALPTDENE